MPPYLVRESSLLVPRRREEGRREQAWTYGRRLGMFSGGQRLTLGMRGSPGRRRRRWRPAPTCCASLSLSLSLSHLAAARSFIPAAPLGSINTDGRGRHGNAERSGPHAPPPPSSPPPRRRLCRTCLHCQRKGAVGRRRHRRRRRSISLTDTDTIGQSNMKNCRLRTKNVQLVRLEQPRAVIVREKRPRQQKRAESKEE